MRSPRISVLIATADRPRLLSGCLESLAASSFTDAEVLVLDQSRDPAELPPQAWSGSPLEFRHIRCPRRGKSAALNLGIAQARGALLAFTDDDCRVARDWLEVMARADGEPGERCALTGRVAGGDPEGNAAVAPSLREDPEEKIYRAPICRDVLFGNNMALPVEFLRKVGPFDEGLGPGTEAQAAEDNDLGYRLLRAGFPIRYLPGMAVIHRFWRKDEEQVGLYRGYGVGQGTFYGKHARRGDLHMLTRMARSLWDAGRDAGGAAVLGRRYDFRTSTAFAAGLLRGFFRSAPGPVRRGRGSVGDGGEMSSPVSPERAVAASEREVRRVVRRISRARVWQYDYLMLREIGLGLAREAATLNGKAGLSVLDVGCKYKPYRGLFEGRASRYVGLDLQAYRGVEVRGDAIHLPFRSDSFDLLLCTQVFHMLRDFRGALSEFVRVTRRGGRVLLTTIGTWPYPPASHLHRWSRRELEELLSEFGEARVEETGGYLQLVPQMANAFVAMGVEGHLTAKYGRAGRALAFPLKGIYLGMNLLALGCEKTVRAAAGAGLGVAVSLKVLDAHLAINYLAVLIPRK